MPNINCKSFQYFYFILVIWNGKNLVLVIALTYFESVRWKWYADGWFLNWIAIIYILWRWWLLKMYNKIFKLIWSKTLIILVIYDISGIKMQSEQNFCTVVHYT